MKIRTAIYPLLISILLFPFIYSCKKGADVPALAITGVTDITGTSATVGANITSDGGAEVTYRGISYGLNQNPTIEGYYTVAGNGTGSFTSSLTNLISGRTYYIRAYAINKEGIAYSAQASFETMVADYDGNVYHKVTIGTQVWMVENLRTLHYRNGEPIPNVSDGTVWANGTLGACCSYGNDEANAETYGMLYNAYAILDPRNIAPAGWHVATHNDYLTLETFLNGNTIAGGKMKETGVTHWISPNTGATNSSGFTALPGGYRGGTAGVFAGIGEKAYFWTSTSQSADAMYGRILDTNSEQSATTTDFKYAGMSVRCVKD
jgi:uncharacterized protein (TIGR02145 family)